MDKTVFKYECDVNEAKKIIDNFISENNFEKQVDESGKVFYRIRQDFYFVTQYAYFEYELSEKTVTIYAYLGRGDKYKKVKIESKLMWGSDYYKMLIYQLSQKLEKISSSFSSSINLGANIEKTKRQSPSDFKLVPFLLMCLVIIIICTILRNR